MKTKAQSLLYFGFMANILVITGVLCGSLYIQLILKEYPCPLCMVQRMCMMMCAVGQLYILVHCRGTQALEWKHFAIGHSMTLFSALAGSMMSARQILLHIVPPDPGYGSAIFGIHLYTWGLIVFFAEIFAVACNLAIAPKKWEPIQEKMQLIAKWVTIIFIAVIIIFALATFNEEGFHWFLEDDPTRNALFNY